MASRIRSPALEHIDVKQGFWKKIAWPRRNGAARSTAVAALRRHEGKSIF